MCCIAAYREAFRLYHSVATLLPISALDSSANVHTLLTKKKSVRGLAAQCFCLADLQSFQNKTALT